MTRAVGDSDPRLVDVAREHPVLGRETVWAGRKFTMESEVVDLGRGGTVVREFLGHPGSVVVLALDDDDRVLMLRQYRHPVRAELWELPAGLRDEPGEPAVRTAARELAEEADVVAGRWWRLVDFLASPGCSDERVEVFLARDLTPVPTDERHQRHAEELDMVTAWVPLDEAAEAILARGVHNPAAVVGVLAAVASRASGWHSLEVVDLAG